ncbi:hypothetical protein N7466_003353 [Penicillium verhagenii]|uniref:uncharacterized protein n=1 Tax=Penicillium verhagenii TaxID=1562060 RepID=UPI002544ED09|nr:uncharacterized protein N7466_003353 [Penicillium verhagenii]KAJ5936903.1 hypothetical protein N7466_003353 [Penicillium verhagenii]
MLPHRCPATPPEAECFNSIRPGHPAVDWKEYASGKRKYESLMHHTALDSAAAQRFGQPRRRLEGDQRNTCEQCHQRQGPFRSSLVRCVWYQGRRVFVVEYDGSSDEVEAEQAGGELRHPAI